MTSTVTTGDAETVGISLVVPMYASEDYLPDLLASFDRQHPGPYTVEYVFVDDGSPDGSADLAQSWLDSSPRRGQVIRQPNGGVSRARNRGIRAARGDWIGLPDGDDFLGDRFLTSVAEAILAQRAKDPVLVATNVKWYHEATAGITDNHVLRFKFASGTRVVDLDQHPRYIQSQAASALFRRDLIRAGNVEFIADLHNAEDALFVADYLMSAPTRRVIMAAGADYLYRKRARGGSAVDTVRDNPDYHFGHFERGYIPAFERASRQGRVPAWLQMTFLYDLRWLFPREMYVSTKATYLTAAEKARVLSLVASGLKHVDDRTITTYRVTDLGFVYRCLFLALKGSPLPEQGTVVVVGDDGRNTEVRYLFTGDLPTERFTVDGSAVEPVAAKIRRLDFFDQRLVCERIVWLPGVGAVDIALDGRQVVPETGTYPAERPDAPARMAPGSGLRARAAYWPRRAARVLVREAAVVAPGAFDSRPPLQRRARRLRARRVARLERLWLRVGRPGRDLEGAWLLMDKLGAAGDSAEYLYRHLRDEERDVNAWFVLRQEAADWGRLSTDGFRLLAYGSRRHRVALQRASVVVSTHLDAEVTNPLPAYSYPHGRPWRFVYLEHGVLQHDLALWFNRKPIDLITTASVDEQRSIVEDYSSYLLTTKQAKLTGFPRHDEVRRLTQQADPSRRNIILFAPTWRDNLLAAKAAPGAPRVPKEPLESTSFGENWLGLVNHSGLARLARQSECHVVFLPHPNFRPWLDSSLVDDHVQYLSSVDSVHELLTRCRAVVTDYSSIFFEAALAGADVSYFQFDRDEFLSGGHTYVPGYWSYEDHGLGPVSLTVDDAVDVLRRQLNAGDDDPERALYHARVERTLPLVDGRSSVRITAEIAQLLSSRGPVTAPTATTQGVAAMGRSTAQGAMASLRRILRSSASSREADTSL